MNTKLITGAAAITKAIDSVAGRGKRLDADIQLAGLSVLAHIEGCGDTTLADRLVNALPKGSRRLALVEWFIAHGKMRVLNKGDKAEAEAIKSGRIFKHDGDRKTDMVGATGTPWHEFRKEPEAATAFDAQAGVMSLINRIKSANEKGMTVEGKAEALQQLDNLRAMLVSE